MRLQSPTPNPLAFRASNNRPAGQATPAAAVRFGSNEHELKLPAFDAVPGYQEALSTVDFAFGWRQDAVKQLLNKMIETAQKADKDSNIPPIRAILHSGAINDRNVESIAQMAGRPLIKLDMTDYYDFNLEDITNPSPKNDRATLASRLGNFNASSAVNGSPRPIVFLSNMGLYPNGRQKVYDLFTQIFKEGKLTVEGKDIDFKGVDFLMTVPLDSMKGLGYLVGPDLLKQVNVESPTGETVRATLKKELDEELSHLKDVFKFPVIVDDSFREKILDTALEDNKNSEWIAFRDAQSNLLRDPLTNMSLRLLMNSERIPPTQVTFSYENDKVRTKYKFPPNA